jgi:hypothetical protein
MTDTDDREARQRTALELAMEWAELPPEYLQVALAALEPQLVREHEVRLKRLDIVGEKARQAFRLRAWGLAAGFLTAVAGLAATLVLGLEHQPWLAAVCSGPSIVVLAKVFVLRRSDPDDVRQVTAALGRIPGAGRLPESPSKPAR